METFDPNDIGIANGNFFGLPYDVEDIFDGESSGCSPALAGTSAPVMWKTACLCCFP